jgi:hypothetical protein
MREGGAKDDVIEGIEVEWFALGVICEIPWHDDRKIIKRKNPVR